jgi:uncharacterized membrane protein YgcG
VSSHQLSIIALLISCMQWITAVPLGSMVYVTLEDVIWETVVITKTVVLCSTTLHGSTSSTRYYTTTSLRPCTSTSRSAEYGPSSLSSRSMSGNATTSLATSSGYESSSGGYVTLSKSSVSQMIFVFCL